MLDKVLWLSPSEAVWRSGLAREAVQERARRGQVTSRMGNRSELLMQLPAELLPEIAMYSLISTKRRNPI
jgi:hypothetical protein